MSLTLQFLATAFFLGASVNSENEISLLISQAREGSEQAIGELMDTVRTYLLLIANQETDVRLQAKVAASDIVQEACLLAHQRFSTFRGTTEGELRRWMRQVLLNSLSDSRKKFLLSQKRAVSREAGPANEQTVESGELTPRSALLAQEEADLLRAAMDRLSPDYRLVLRLRNWELLSFAEIGEQIERSDDAAQKLWRRAVRALKEELGE